MLSNMSGVKLAGAWCAAVAVIGAGSVVMGASLRISTVGLLLAASLVPLAVVWFLSHNAPTATVAEVLHAADVPSNDVRP